WSLARHVDDSRRHGRQHRIAQQYDPHHHAHALRHGRRWLLAGCSHAQAPTLRSEEHTSELQSLTNLVCRLLLEKKKKKTQTQHERKNKDESRGRITRG